MRSILKKICANKLELLFFLLVFLVLFRQDAIPFQTDEWGYPVAAKYVSSQPFSAETIKVLNEYQLLSRPLALFLFVPFYLAFGNNYLLAMPFFHLFLSLLTLLLIYFNFKLFEKLFGKATAFLSSFLLSASFFVVYSLWYTASVNIIIATFCLVAAIYFFTKIGEKKSLYIIPLLIVWGALTRETIVIALLLSVIALLVTRKTARKLNIVVSLSLPFAVFAIAMFLLTGFVVQPLHSGMISTSSNPLANLQAYFDYWFGYYLLTPILGFSIFVFITGTIFAARKKLWQSIKKQVFLPWLSLSERQSTVVVLIAAFIGGLVPLALASQTSPRYVVPVLPIIFGFTAKFFCDAVLERLGNKAKSFFLAFLLANLAFWVLFFNTKNLLAVFGNNSIEILSLAFNALFFLIVVSVPAFAVFYFFKTKEKKVLHLLVLGALAIMSFLLAFSSIVQLNELSVFYVTHYHNSLTAFEANKFLAENIPEKATVYNEQDLSWIFFLSLEAFGRKDIALVLHGPDSGLKKGDYLVFNSRAAQQIREIVQKDKNRLELLASFGGTQKKYPRSSLEKSSLLKNGTLFSLFWDVAERIDIYRVK